MGESNGGVVGNDRDCLLGMNIVSVYVVHIILASIKKGEPMMNQQSRILESSL